MGERVPVKITNKQLKASVWELVGMSRIADALGDVEAHAKLPGFALALALVEREVADARARLSGDALRQASKAGHDIAMCTNVFTYIRDGEPALEVELADLVDQAAKTE